MATRATMLFNLITQPGENAPSAPRTAGWTESVWFPADIPLDHNGFHRIRQRRAALMPSSAAITGVRLSRYTLIGNRLVSLGSVVKKEHLAGSARLVTDIPQMALQYDCSAVGKTNKTQLTVAAIPDAVVTGGEYMPSAHFRDAANLYGITLVTEGACFLGRDLSQASLRVMSIAGGVVTLEAALAGAVVGSSIRLARVNNSVTGAKISGAFTITAINGAAYTVMGLAGITADQGGTARLDVVTLCQFAGAEPSSIRTRKVGRPLNGYRGRASRR